ncbi:MAG: hypothetical protein V1839_01265, partial [archaeon]
MGLEEKLASLRKASDEIRDRKLGTAHFIALSKAVGDKWLERKGEIAERLSKDANYSKAMAYIWVEPTAQIFYGAEQIYGLLGKNGARYLDEWHQGEGDSCKRHAEPLGVVGVVGVQNAFPANIMYMWNVLSVPGNTVLFKPASGDDVTVHVIKELIEDVIKNADKDSMLHNSPYVNAIESEYWKGGEDIEKE